MKNKILNTVLLAILLAFAGNVSAVGQNSNGGMGTSNKVQQQTQTVNQGESGQIQTQNNEQTQSGAVNQAGINMETQTQQQTQRQLQDGSGTGNQSQNQENSQKQEQINIQVHQNAVASFVQGLLRVADREGGIGEQVRTIAQEQNQSASTTIQAMEKVQTRNKIKTFFLGSDYKNLGELRSEAAQTMNRLSQLNNLMEKVENEADKTELQKQIQTLQQEQVKIEAFIKAQEEKFSLFGWLVKFFAK